MEGEFIENQRLTIRLPNKQRYSNPCGYMQGGIITAAIDNTVSPFSYIVAPSSITQEITTKYKRAVTSDDQYIQVTATLMGRNQTHIKLKGEVKNVRGKIVAWVVATAVFIKKQITGISILVTLPTFL